MIVRRALIMVGVILVTGIVWSPALQATDTEGVVTASINLGRVRATPEMEGEIVFKLRAGKEYRFTQIQGDWYQVVLSDGRSGWAHRSIFEGPVAAQRKPPTLGRCGEADGIIEASTELEISSEVDGIIEEVFVDRGDWVTAEQTIAALKSKVQETAVELAKARVQFGRRKTQRNEELYRKDLISIHQRDELATELKIAELKYIEAREQLRLRTVTSPIKGIVVERYLSAGEHAGQKPIVRIARIDPLNVEVIAPKECYRSIRVGMRAQVLPESPVNGKYMSRVAVIDQVFDAASGTFGVRLKLPNPKNKLPAGVKCRIRFIQD